jgi:16S rRNA (guanine966-N2)-methyltransferase
LRVIGGTARGRRLRAPRLAGVRPTSDRVREAIFDVLSSLDAVEGATAADLFAGSGALGIEALSRGAQSCLFVESDPAALEVIEKNLTATGFDDRARLVRTDVFSWLRAAEALDLALVDPPYRFDRWDELLARLRAEIVVLESRREVPLPEGITLHRRYHYGGTLVTVARKSSPARRGPEEGR